MAGIKKTILMLEVNDKEYHVSYNGTFSFPITVEERRHNERLMNVLHANDDLLNFLYNIVMPVVRCKRREARKAAKEQIKC